MILFELTCPVCHEISHCNYRGEIMTCKECGVSQFGYILESEGLIEELELKKEKDA